MKTSPLWKKLISLSHSKCRGGFEKFDKLLEDVEQDEVNYSLAKREEREHKINPFIRRQPKQGPTNQELRRVYKGIYLEQLHNIHNSSPKKAGGILDNSLKHFQLEIFKERSLEIKRYKFEPFRELSKEIATIEDLYEYGGKDPWNSKNCLVQKPTEIKLNSLHSPKKSPIKIHSQIGNKKGQFMYQNIGNFKQDLDSPRHSVHSIYSNIRDKSEEEPTDPNKSQKELRLLANQRKIKSEIDQLERRNSGINLNLFISRHLLKRYSGDPKKKTQIKTREKLRNIKREKLLSELNNIEKDLLSVESSAFDLKTREIEEKFFKRNNSKELIRKETGMITPTSSMSKTNRAFRSSASISRYTNRFQSTSRNMENITPIQSLNNTCYSSIQKEKNKLSLGGGRSKCKLINPPTIYSAILDKNINYPIIRPHIRILNKSILNGSQSTLNLSNAKALTQRFRRSKKVLKIDRIINDVNICEQDTKEDLAQLRETIYSANREYNNLSHFRNKLGKVSSVLN